MTTTTMTMQTPTATATATTRWADSPFPLIKCPLSSQAALNDPSIHAAEIMAHEMMHLHNMIIRGLNSIWQQAPYVTSESDVKDFLQYCLHWHNTILHHHATEEDYFFPALEDLLGGQKGCMDTNIEQHRAFEAGLDRFFTYCNDTTTTTPSTYSGGALRAVINSFGHILSEHLADEIPTLLALKPYDDKKLRAIWKKSGDYARSHGEMGISLPYLIGTFDVTHDGKAVTNDFILPFFLYWANDMVISKKYAGAWRFLPCDKRSRPQTLAFGAKG